MNRRECIALLGGAAASSASWPLAARAQQPAKETALPVVGFLDARSPDAMGDRLRGYRQGLKDTGYADGDNVTIAYRWAENRLERLPELAAELIHRRVAVLVVSGGTSAMSAAKAATSTVPTVFIVADDPVKMGLVASLARPGGNRTGVNFFNTELAGKQLELLRELVPRALRIAVVINPGNNANAESTLHDVEPAARAMGLQLQLLKVSTSAEINAAFAAFAGERPDALFVANDAFFNGRRVQLTQLAAHHHLPAIYSGREYSEVGGLMSYGTNIAEAYHQIGVYTGRILKGAKPADLPVVQASKFELIINLQTARMLGIAVPDKLLATADEVIE
jgi:putative tryptophan/tyrosine transport system substrate-binding protein